MMRRSKRSVAQRALGFVKTTLIGGVLFLVPVLILSLLVAKLGALLRRMAEPLSAHLPVHDVPGLLVADTLVLGFLVLVCFCAGLLARVSFAQRFVKRAEAGVLWRIPGYGFVKGLTDSLDNSDATAAMRPVLVHFDDYAQLAFEVDKLGDGRRIIYVPSAPDPRAGAVFVFDEARVEAVPLSFVAAIGSIRALGRGVGPALARHSHASA